MQLEAKPPATSEPLPIIFSKVGGKGGGKSQYKEFYRATPGFTSESLYRKERPVLLPIVFFQGEGDYTQLEELMVP